jgi:hypothetical protein
MGEREKGRTGVLEYWSSGVVEYGRDELAHPRAAKLCVLCVFVVKLFFYFRSPFTVADFAHDSQDGVVWLIF